MNVFPDPQVSAFLSMVIVALSVGHNVRTTTVVQAIETPADSIEIHARAVVDIAEFFVGWQMLWRESESRRALRWEHSERLSLRLPYVHCHPDLATGQRVIPRGGTDVVGRPFSAFPVVSSKMSIFAVCPTWILGGYPVDAADESVWKDGALVPSLRGRAAVLRATLIARIDSALLAWPSSAMLVGQLVRFQVDQRRFDDADASAARCQASVWWCRGLAGYAKARRGASLDAELLYELMRAAMTPEERCRWLDVGNLLPAADAAQFAALLCAERVSAANRLWWLADPLFRVPGNERQVIHETRLIDVALRRALDSDERYPWDTARGGDAMAKSIERYGTPTYAAWGGAKTDLSHSMYVRMHRSEAVDPYTTQEYTRDRVHLLPSWTATREPFGMTASDWTLTKETDEGELELNWWPDEHARINRRLLSIPEGQTALFRRQTFVSLVTAHQITHPSLADSAEFDVMLLASTAANDIDSLDQKRARFGNTVVLQSPIRTSPFMLGVEAIGIGSTGVDARTRYAVVPPAPLSAMSANEVAISPPALIQATSEGAPLPVPDESLLDQLLGSTTLGPLQRRVVVYWETYGIHATDTATISVTMTSAQELSTLRKVGMALNLASDPTRSLQIRWTEPSSQHNTRTLTGPIPVQLRSLVLNLAQLAPGPYILTVGVERKGNVVATSERRVVIQ